MALFDLAARTAAAASRAAAAVIPGAAAALDAAAAVADDHPEDVNDEPIPPPEDILADGMSPLLLSLVSFVSSLLDRICVEKIRV